MHMILVKIGAEFPIQVSDNAACYGDSHPEYINQNKNLVLNDVAEGNENVVS
jgi:hypothetical protein